MAAEGPPPHQQLVDFEADSDDLAWAGEAEAAAQQQQQQQQQQDDFAAAAANAAANAAAPAPGALPPHLAARLGPAPQDHAMPEEDDDDEGALPHHHTRSARRRFEPARSADGWVLFVTGLVKDAAEDDVLDHFSCAGHVKNLSLGLGRETGHVAGYALVEYEDEGSARRAVEELDGGEFLGATLRVDWAFVKPRGKDEDVEEEIDPVRAEGLRRRAAGEQKRREQN